MAEPKTTINKERVSFRFSIPNISKLNGHVWSREVLIHGVPWKIYAYKNVLKPKPSLGLLLHCAKSGSTSHWSHVASATFELLSFKSECSTQKFDTRPYVFDHSNRYYGFKNIIRWADLFDAENNYVKDDTIHMQIEIYAEANTAKVTSFERINENCYEEGSAAFRVTVSNVECLVAVKTAEFVLQKIPCELVLFKHSNNLSIKLFLKQSHSVSQNFSFFIELTADLVSSNVGSNRCGKAHGSIGRYKHGIRIPQLVPWDDLLQPRNGFIKDGAITIELEIKTELIQIGCVLVSARKRKTNVDQPATKHSKLTCEICKKTIIDQDISSLPCGHLLCAPCITESVNGQKGMCPSCDVGVIQNGLSRILLH